jgi:hypothetical protein
VVQQFNKDISLTRDGKRVNVYKKEYAGIIGASEASAAAFDNRFSEKEVHEICKDIAMGVSLTEIAKAHNTYRNRIDFIASNRTYREISKLYW